MRRRRALSLLGSGGLAVLATVSAARAASSWLPIGPEGGTVDFVASAPSAPQTVYASSKTGGVFASADAGATWRSANVGISDLRVQCLAVSPDDPRVVYAGSYTGGFKTTDGGASWTPLGGGFPSALVSAIAFDPSHTSTLYAVGTSGTVVKSTDGGASWTSIGNAGLVAAMPRILAVDPSRSTTLYLGTLQGGMFRSTDGGSSWTAQNSGLTDQFNNVYAVTALAVDPTNASRMLVGTATAGVFESTDSGGSWNDSLNGAGLGLVTSLLFGSNGTAYLSLQQGIYVLSPGATTWSGIPAPIGFVNAIALGDGSAPAIYVAFGRFPLDPGGFARLGTGSISFAYLPLYVVAALAADPSTPGRALAAMTVGPFVYESGSANGPWSASGLGGGSSSATNIPPVAVLFDSRTPGLVYGGAGGKCYVSADGGTTTSVTALVGEPSIPLTVVRSFVEEPGTAQGVFAGTSKGLFHSADSGASWSAASTDLSARRVFALTADRVTPAVLWAGTDDGVYRSTDAGGHWTRSGAGPGGVVHTVLALPAGPTFAGADSGLYASPDGGASWQAAGVGAAVNALVADPTTGTLFAGTVSGVYESADGGATWSAGSDGLGNPDVLCLARLSDGIVLAGTNGGSVYQRVSVVPRVPPSREAAPSAPRVVAPRP